MPKVCYDCQVEQRLQPRRVYRPTAEQAARAVAIRWSKASPDDRRAVGEGMAAARWAGHVKAEPTSQPRQMRACKFCGDVVLMASRQIRCSKDDCRLSYNADRMGIYHHDRRARKRSVPNERIVPAAVFERDGWVCWICETPVDRNARPKSSASPSLDHVIPLSRGGSHTLDNVRCAHFGCNARRGNRVA